MIYSFLLKPILFLFPAEKAHQLAMNSFKILLSIPLIGSFIRRLLRYEHAGLSHQTMGLSFPNPVGLAAGFDKNGEYIEVLDALGFGFIEVGTVTPLPQDGNPKPRLFRLPKDEALINRMGFNNGGVIELTKRLKKIKKRKIIIGANIGKNKVTPNAEAYKDYNICFDALHAYVDYLVVNVSSPNTPGLRELQEKGPLNKILSELQLRNNKIGLPILLKIAPDINESILDDIIEVVLSNKLAGIIVNNTTTDRSNLRTTQERLDKIGNGGLSGRPLKKRADELIDTINKKTNDQLTIIGVGGIMSGEDAEDKINLGASLIQVYTGFIYQGPIFIKNIKKHLSRNSYND